MSVKQKTQQAHLHLAYNSQPTKSREEQRQHQVPKATHQLLSRQGKFVLDTHHAKTFICAAEKPLHLQEHTEQRVFCT